MENEQQLKKKASRVFTDQYRLITDKSSLVNGTKYKKAYLKNYNIVVHSFIYLGPNKAQSNSFAYVPLKKGVSTKEIKHLSFDELFNNSNVVWGGFLEETLLKELLLQKT